MPESTPLRLTRINPSSAFTDDHRPSVEESALRGPIEQFIDTRNGPVAHEPDFDGPSNNPEEENNILITHIQRRRESLDVMLDHARQERVAAVHAKTVVDQQCAEAQAFEDACHAAIAAWDRAMGVEPHRSAAPTVQDRPGEWT